MKKLIIAEKEEAGREIANILGEGVFDTQTRYGIDYFVVGDTVIVSARGHLIRPTIKGLRSVKSVSQLPLSEVKWTIPKNSKARLKLIGEEMKNSDEVVVATDYDREGEVIGFNIIKHFGSAKHPAEVKRAYFSSLTEDEIKQAFGNINSMDEALLTQGLSRNHADVIVGLNLTKALTLIFKKQYKSLSQAMSLGRVQSPLLSHISKETAIDMRDEAYLDEKKGERWKHYLIINGRHYRLGIDQREPLPKKINVNKVWKETSETEQAEELYNTDEIQTATELDPNAVDRTMESMYLKGWMTYPRTKSKYIEPNRLKKLEQAIRAYKELPEGFSYQNCPIGEREAKKDPLVLTEKGIKAFFENRMRGREKIIAVLILSRMLRSFAPPIRMTKTKAEIEIEVDELQSKIGEIVWSKETEDLEHTVSFLEKTERRPKLVKGVYDATSICEPEDTVEVIEGIYDTDLRFFKDVDLLRWMSEEKIGTEATRSSFPNLLRTRNYTGESNLPTVLGEEVSKIIDELGITTELTAEMEGRMEKLSKIDELPDFVNWVVDQLTDYLSHLRGTPTIDLKCPSGHDTELVNTKYGLMMLCRKCKADGKFYRI